MRERENREIWAAPTHTCDVKKSSSHAHPEGMCWGLVTGALILFCPLSQISQAPPFTACPSQSCSGLASLYEIKMKFFLLLKCGLLLFAFFVRYPSLTRNSPRSQGSHCCTGVGSLAHLGHFITVCLTLLIFVLLPLCKKNNFLTWGRQKLLWCFSS